MIVCIKVDIQELHLILRPTVLDIVQIYNEKQSVSQNHWAMNGQDRKRKFCCFMDKWLRRKNWITCLTL